MNWFVAIGGVGGFIILLTAIVAIGRGIFRQINATEENTDAVRDLTKGMGEIKGMISNHETRISVLEDRVKRP
jgi:hypothetical protein